MTNALAYSIKSFVELSSGLCLAMMAVLTRAKRTSLFSKKFCRTFLRLVFGNSCYADNEKCTSLFSKKFCRTLLRLVFGNGCYADNDKCTSLFSKSFIELATDLCLATVAMLTITNALAYSVKSFIELSLLRLVFGNDGSTDHGKMHPLIQ